MLPNGGSRATQHQRRNYSCNQLEGLYAIVREKKNDFHCSSLDIINRTMDFISTQVNQPLGKEKECTIF